MRQLNFIFLIVLYAYTASSAAAQSRGEHCVMFYNVENLFHPSDDSTVADDDFTPEGVRRWNYHRYKRKIAKVCKVILAVNGWEPPDVVCLSEIENGEVLTDIIFHPLMLGQKYLSLHRDSPDHRGIDVGIIYRRDRLECLDTTWIEIRNAQDQLVPTREILAATFRLIHTGDTVVIFSNHWTSKYGGALETEGKRLLQSRLLGEYIITLLDTMSTGGNIGKLSGSMPQGLESGTLQAEQSPGSQRIGIIAGGDLNDLSGSKPVQLLSDTYSLEEVLPGSGVVREEVLPGSGVVREDPSMPSASYKYRGNWGSIDHVFVGGKLRAEDCRARVFSHPLLLEKDTKYTGVKPFRTYNGFKYQGGISDHLPLILEFRMQTDRKENLIKDRRKNRRKDQKDDLIKDRKDDLIKDRKYGRRKGLRKDWKNAPGYAPED